MEFVDEWKYKRLNDFCTINPYAEDLKEKFVYIDLDSVVDGCLLKKNIICKINAPSRAQRTLQQNDILFQCVRPYQMNNLFFENPSDNLQYVASTGYAQIRTKEFPPFIYYLLHSSAFNRKVLLLCTGSSYPAISSFDLANIVTNICSRNEQLKIGLFLNLLDKRIRTQNKIIEDLKILKNALTHKLIFHNNKLNKRVPLKSLATIKNGYAFKSDSYTDKGKFKIITIANVQRNRYINTSTINKIVNIPSDIQSHQTLEKNDILISLTGNVGRVSLVNENNCLLNQRVGVLKCKDEKLKEYIFQAISSNQFERTMILRGQGAAQKNIGNSDVESFLIPLSDDLSYINKISQTLKLIDKKIAIEEQIINDYISQKKFII